MAVEASTYRRFLAGPNGVFVAALSAAAILLVGAAVVGARNASENAPAQAAEEPGVGTPTDEPTQPGVAAPTLAPATSGPRATTGPRATANPNAPAPAGAPPKAAVSAPGRTRIGIFNTHFEVGAHAPITFDGAPLPLAEDPVTGLKGYITFINKNGGINGRKIRLFLQDDRYTTAGARLAADRLVKEVKPFLLFGTLGIDQVAIVAKAAKQVGMPYVAGGGPEQEFKNTGMYQGYVSYDESLRQLVDFICKFGPQYVGVGKKSDVRIATSRLNSEWIAPVEKRFIQALTQRKCVRTPVDPNARGTIRKPTEQTTYQDQLLKLRNSYAGMGANLVVPLQDPISTSRQTAELKPYQASGYDPKWVFSNFAHDSDTALTLQGGDWEGVRGLSPGCYYLSKNAYNPKFCAAMGKAHSTWVKIGNVNYDENAGGSAGGKSNYNYNESSWQSDGSGGAYGYQLVYFFFGAMKSIGADPTREKFVSALNLYSGYSDLITGPISFKGTSNRMIGADEFVLLEGQNNLKFRQVTEITPGLVDHF